MNSEDNASVDYEAKAKLLGEENEKLKLQFVEVS